MRLLILMNHGGSRKVFSAGWTCMKTRTTTNSRNLHMRYFSDKASEASKATAEQTPPDNAISGTASALSKPIIVASETEIAKNVDPSRHISSSDAASVNLDAAAAAAAAKIIAKEAKPRPIFPWRHENVSNVLPRLTPGTREFIEDFGLGINATGQKLLANCFLNVPFWKNVLNPAWGEEFSEPFAFAFTRAVAGVVSNVYEISNTFEADSARVNFSSTTDVKNEKEKTDGEPSNKSDTERPKFVKDPIVESMLDRPLRNLYQSAHEFGRHQLDIRLDVVPEFAVLYRIFAIPWISRQACERDPQLLRRFYETVLKRHSGPEERFKFFFNNFYDQARANDGTVVTTVEVQVLIQCKEVFWVKDKETGLVLQGSVPKEMDESGSPKRSPTLHLARFETNIETRDSHSFLSLPKSKVGNWVLTDIDYLIIDGVKNKPWYLK